MLVRAAVLIAVAGIVLGIAPAAPGAAQPDLRVRIISAGPTSLTLKGHMYTTVGVENIGTGVAEQIVLWIRVPKVLSIRSPNAHAGIGGCYPRGHDWKCELAGLEPDEGFSVVMDARAVKRGAGVLRFILSEHQRDAHPADNRKSIHVRIGSGPARADLSLSAEPVGTPQAGIPSLFRFHVRNAGPAAADQITLRVEMTSEGFWVGADFVQSPFSGCGPTDDAQKVVICTVDFVDAHSSAEVGLAGYLRLGDVSFRMSITSKTADPVSSNNSSSLTAAVGPPARTADLGVALEVPPHSPIGQPVTFKAHVTNHGPDEAHDVSAFFVVFSDDATDAPELVSLSASRGTCAGAACSFGTMPAGETITLTLVLIFHGPGTFNVGAITEGRDDAYDPGRYETLPPEQRDSWNGYGEQTVVSGQALSFSRSRSLTTRGFALPRVSFMTCPTRKPSTPSLPARYAAACSSWAARTWSITGSSSDSSAISVSPR
jgi:hypothetical protein